MRKSQVYAKGMLYGLFCLSMTFLCLRVLLHVLVATIHFGIGDGAILFTLLIVFFIVLTFVAYSADQYNETRKAAAEVAFVPPVTADTLPAEEVLVRSSEEPSVFQREVLLRAATEGETPKEELMRVAEE